MRVYKIFILRYLENQAFSNRKDIIKILVIGLPV